MLNQMLSVPAELNPEGVTIRLAGTSDRPLFCLADLCAVLGNADASTSARRLEDEEKVPHNVRTPGGDQEMLFITEPGLYRIVMTSRADNARPFQRWVFGEVLPSIRKHCCYPPPAAAVTTCELLLANARQIAAQAEQLVELERRQAQQAVAVEAISCRIQAVEESRRQANRHLLEVAPDPEGAQDKPVRGKLNELMRSYCQATEADYAVVWGRLFRELYYRCHFDAQARARHSKRSPLDHVQEAGLLVELYRIAAETLTV